MCHSTYGGERVILCVRSRDTYACPRRVYVQVDTKNGMPKSGLCEEEVSGEAKLLRNLEGKFSEGAEGGILQSVANMLKFI